MARIPLALRMSMSSVRLARRRAVVKDEFRDNGAAGKHRAQSMVETSTAIARVRGCKISAQVGSKASKVRLRAGCDLNSRANGQLLSVACPKAPCSLGRLGIPFLKPLRATKAHRKLPAAFMHQPTGPLSTLRESERAYWR